MKTEMKDAVNIIVDCDPGNGVPGANVDDALAIAYALRSEKLKTRAIWTVFGNTTSDLGYSSAEALLRSMGRMDVPVRRGADGPLQGSRQPWLTKRLNAASSPEAPEAWRNAVGSQAGFRASSVDKVSAIPEVSGPDQLAQDVLACSGPVSIAAIGPLTNLARLISDEPQVVGHIERISIMGGAIGFGDEVDTNFAVDPVAARRVLESGIPITLVPLDVTRTTHLSQRCWDRMIAEADASKAPWKDSMNRWLRPWLTYSRRTRPVDGMWLHDLVSVLALAERDLVALRPARVNLADSGKLLLADRNGDQPVSGVRSYEVELCTGVDNSRMIQVWQQAVLPR